MMRNHSIDDDEYDYAEFILDIAVQDPASWLMDVPKILRFIHESLSDCTTSKHLKLFSVLCTLANEFPRELLISILTDLPTLDSTTLDIWKATLSLPMNSEKSLQELQNVLQDKRVCSFFEVNTVDLSTVHLAMMRPKDQILVDLCDPERLQVCLRLQSLPMLWLVLRALTMLSERPKMGRTLLVLLPDVMNTLQYDNTHITVKALTVFKNVIGYLEKREASPIALALAERLLPLFNNVRLLWVTEPCRWALCNGVALQPRPVGSTRAGPSSLSAPLGSCELSSGLCSPTWPLPVELRALGSQRLLFWGQEDGG
ncbi:uncharacterized protein LOC121063424 isoform X3 [Cygnus olor]|uniref:uncharacterized protein LOC121063424 isoform X3 n=1 Tax=Cygnus olor TaxID=8869 RepID=UPI001ADE36D2|nr:uncharacterized protein LOC121063424 isoform X3 [Cygnus olor]